MESNLQKNKLATPTEVAKATGVSYGYANQLMKRIGTQEVFEKNWFIYQFDEAILRAPIRDNYNVWKDRAMHRKDIIAIVVVIGAATEWCGGYDKETNRVTCC